MESSNDLNNLQISCKKCNTVFKQGDHVVMTCKTKFYHLLCYQSKGSFFRFFNKATNYVTWTDVKILDDCISGINELIKEKQQKLQEHDNLQDSIASSVFIAVDEKGDNKEAVQRTCSVSSKTNILLNENLEQLMVDVNELKQQINYFADEKSRDENIIKMLKIQNQSYKKQICELQWHLHISIHSNTNHNISSSTINHEE